MLSQQEESQILRGIDEIIFNLRHVPTQELANFLVKFNPELADELASAISFQFFDKNEGKKYE